MIEIFTDANLTKVKASALKRLNTLNESGINAKFLTKIQETFQDYIKNNLPLEGTFNYWGEAGEGEYVHLRIGTDKDNSVSFSNLLTLGLPNVNEGEDKPIIMFAPTKNPKMGLLGNISSFNNGLTSLGAKHKLNLVELAELLMGVKYTAKLVPVLTYYPKTSADGTLQMQTAVELNKLDDINKLALCKVKMVYKILTLNGKPI